MSKPSIIESAEAELELELKYGNRQRATFLQAYIQGAQAQLGEDLKALVEYDRHIREKHEREFREKYGVQHEKW